MAEKVCQPWRADPGNTARWSYARWLHLSFHRSWDSHFRELWRARVYLGRYLRQPMEWILELPVSDLWRYVYYTSKAIEAEQPKKKK